jgi:hypothetical protein
MTYTRIMLKILLEVHALPAEKKERDGRIERGKTQMTENSLVE